MPHIQRFTGLMLLVGTAMLSACEKQTTTTSTTTTNEQTAAAPEGSVNREVVAAPEQAPPAPTQAVIQTQPGPQGAQVALNKVAVTGDVLTVQLTYTGTKGFSSPAIQEISVIDDATAQRIGVLKDNAGQWLAAPLLGKNQLGINVNNSPVIVWAKFPAPPTTSKTVSINIPEVAPFDGVPVTR